MIFCLTGLNYLAAQTELIPEDQPYVIDSVVLSGNKITRDPIILREMVIHAGDTIRADKLAILKEQSRENLINTLLFNFVEVESLSTTAGSNHLVILVSVIERWYVWPVPILKLSDRNFNVWWETKDFSRISYGLNVNWQNFRGRKENLAIRIQYGYDRIIDFQYSVPYLNRRKTFGMSFGGGAWQQNETAVKTRYNKQQFYKDPDDFAKQELFGFGQLLLRPNIYNSHLIEVRYDYHHFSDSLLKQNENYSVNQENDLQYLSLRYVFKSDHRDYKQYPLKGYYADVELIKHGLFKFSQNTLNTFYILATARKYWELSRRFYFASGLNGKISAGDTQPYFLMRGLGYGRDFVRSYEYYVIEAQHYILLKNNLKFALIPVTVREIGFIRSEKFRKVFYALYLNALIDAAYSSCHQDFGKETNDLQNSFLLGYGAGIDFVTYYDVVIRLEFSVNLKNEAGVFLHFRAPI